MKNWITSQLKNKPTQKVYILFLILGICFTWIPISANCQEKTCVDCHKALVSRKFIHGPVDADCTFCHESTGVAHPNKGVKGFSIIFKGSELCYNCHTEHHEANTSNRYVHAALADGSCTDCHEIHSSNDPKFLSTSVPELCTTCHYDLEESMANLPVVHLPLKEGKSCVACHSAHSSPESKLLISSERSLCISCHLETISKGKMQHAPVDDGCIQCHVPHTSENLNLLFLPYPSGNYASGDADNYGLCFTCHDSEALTQQTTQYATNFRNGDLNLHYLHVNREKGRTCYNCHNVHGSLRSHLIAETVKFGRWDMPLNYSTTPNGGSCSTGCHKNWKYDRLTAIPRH